MIAWALVVIYRWLLNTGSLTCWSGLRFCCMRIPCCSGLRFCCVRVTCVQLPLNTWVVIPCHRMQSQETCFNWRIKVVSDKNSAVVQTAGENLHRSQQIHVLASSNWTYPWTCIILVPNPSQSIHTVRYLVLCDIVGIISLGIDCNDWHWSFKFNLQPGFRIRVYTKPRGCSSCNRHSVNGDSQESITYLIDCVLDCNFRNKYLKRWVWNHLLLLHHRSWLINQMHMNL
jgi:hypothetical protein